MIDKDRFLLILEEKYSLIIDERIMTYNKFAGHKLIMSNGMVIRRFNGQHQFYYNEFNSTQYITLFTDTINMWNTEAEKLIVKHDNLKKLIDKI
jgi:hypothetical protein